MTAKFSLNTKKYFKCFFINESGSQNCCAFTLNIYTGDPKQISNK